MIKINLLGVAPPPTKAVAGPPATRAFQVGTFVGALVVCLAILGLFYTIWSGAVATLQQDLKREQAEQARLAAIKAENERYQQQIRQLEQRNNTIEMLQTGRTGPVEMMAALGDVVNRTEDLYLYSVAPSSERLSIRGQSNSVGSMAAFMAWLKRSGSFQDVQLRQFFEDDQNGRLTYKFTLDCIHRSPSAAAAQPAAPARPARPRRAGK